MKRDPELYDYLPYDQKRPKITWPNGARIAFWVAPNIEFYEMNPPPSPGRNAWPRPLPDTQNYSHRDYGNRAGFQRMLDIMDRCGIRGSVSLNVATSDHHPEIIEECAKRGWEFYSHGTYNTRYMFNMSEDQEREIIQDSIDTIKKYSGQKLDGWLSPSLSYTDRTLDIVAEMGLTYICDLFHDDQPSPLNVRSGRLVSIPYSLEMNDFISLVINLVTPQHYGEILKRQFDRLYAEGEESGTVMCIPLHPYLIGQPHRLKPFEDALAYIARHDKVWMPTGREIAQHFLDHNYDDFKKASSPVGEAP